MTKVSIYVNDDVWLAFKEKVFQKNGNLRCISREVENLLAAEAMEDQVVSGFRKMEITVKGTITSREIKEKRPKLKGPPSEEIIREMRSKRHCLDSTSTPAQC
ncbi:MAG: hypothetical protein ABSG33_09180 [Candidatus Bathyarchaeia archaeon]